MYNEVVRGKVTGIQNFVAIIHEKYLAHTARMAVRLLPLEFTAWGKALTPEMGMWAGLHRTWCIVWKNNPVTQGMFKISGCTTLGRRGGRKRRKG